MSESDETDSGGVESGAGGADWGGLAALPGHPMIWVLISGELAIFGALILGFAVGGRLDPLGYGAAQQVFDRHLATLNTIILLTSSWAAARAVRATLDEAIGRARHWLSAAMGLGALFLVIKAIEWGAEAGLGASLTGPTPFVLYYLTTGFHAAHVGLGLVLLAVAWYRPQPETVETAAALWHMVDLLWVLLFPAFYLVQP